MTKPTLLEFCRTYIPYPIPEYMENFLHHLEKEYRKTGTMKCAISFPRISEKTMYSNAIRIYMERYESMRELTRNRPVMIIFDDMIEKEKVDAPSTK